MRLPAYAAVLPALFLLAACGDAPPDGAASGSGAAGAGAGGEAGVSVEAPEGLSWTTEQDTTHRVAVVTGLEGPEAVRWDPEQRVWFVSNFGGDQPGDGFISRVSAEGRIEDLRFIVGDSAAPLDDPRGMAILGDTLFVADARGVHGFNRVSGARVRFIDFSQHDPGFLNDVAVGPRDRLWVSDTGRSRLYTMSGRIIQVAIEDPQLGPPNGITWDADRGRFLVAPWEGPGAIKAWQQGGMGVEHLASSLGGSFDGIEVVDGRVLAASQADSTIHVLDMDAGATRRFIRVAGRPADIGVDPEGRRIAVPYIALDRVDIWALPPR